MSSILPPRENSPQPGQSKAPHGRYDYFMVQIPANILMDSKKLEGNELAIYIQDLANKFSKEGWEFYRIDNMSIAINPGCFAALFGAGQQRILYSIMTFRRLRP